MSWSTSNSSRRTWRGANNAKPRMQARSPLLSPERSAGWTAFAPAPNYFANAPAAAF